MSNAVLDPVETKSKARSGLPMPYAFFGGQIVPMEEARLTIASQSLQYGLSCFAGIRVYRGEAMQVFRLRDHFDRLVTGAKILGMHHDARFEEFFDAVQELAKLNAPEGDFYIRPFFYTACEELGPHFVGRHYQLGIYMVPIGQYYTLDRGLRLMISSWRKYGDASISVKAKAGGAYLNSALSTTEAKLSGFDEALLLDQHGHVVEASVANIILSYRGELYVPPVGSAVLDGYTTRTVLEILKHEGIPVRREPVDRSMVYSADELLLTGTGAQISFTHSVDGRAIGTGTPGPLCELLRERFGQILRGELFAEKGWLTTL